MFQVACSSDPLRKYSIAFERNRNWIKSNWIEFIFSIEEKRKKKRQGRFTKIAESSATIGTIDAAYLTDGATIKPIKIKRRPTTGCDGGISKICFKKNVLSSVTCQNMTNCDTDKNRMYVDFGFSHRTVVQLTGVNCKTTRFILPVVDEISRMLAHLYSRISRILTIFKPHQMPKPLQMSTSNIKASHQHSMKFGSKWANVISVISHIIEIAHRMPTWRMRIAWNNKTICINFKTVSRTNRRRENYLEHPTAEMAVSKYVNMCPKFLQSDHRTIHAIFLQVFQWKKNSIRIWSALKWISKLVAFIAFVLYPCLCWMFAG